MKKYIFTIILGLSILHAETRSECIIRWERFLAKKLTLICPNSHQSCRDNAGGDCISGDPLTVAVCIVLKKEACDIDFENCKEQAQLDYEAGIAGCPAE